mgnify:CR=1 FL=1
MNKHCGSSWSGLGPYARILPASQLKQFVDDFESLLRTLSGLALSSPSASSAADISAAISTHATLPAEAVPVISQVVAARKPELQIAALESVSRISGSPQLVDFDWKVQLAVSSSKKAVINTPLLMLTLWVRDAQGTRSSIEVEMGLEQLDDIIATLDKINKARIELKV